MANRSITQPIFLSLMMAAVPMVASAVVPITVKTVPWVAASPATPHNSWKNTNTTLKGTANVQGATISYDWDPGDGGTHCTGTVSNQYAIECVYNYNLANATVGNVFAATLTVWDSTTGSGPPSNTATNLATGSYYVQIYNPPTNLTVEVNKAIDDGLWYLHKTMTRGSVTSGTGSGSGASVSVNVDINPASATYGQVITANLNSGGSGYTGPGGVVVVDGYCSPYKSAPYITQACGADFAASLTITAGVVTAVSITNPGHDYALRYNGGSTPSGSDSYYQLPQVTVFGGVLATFTTGSWNGNSPAGISATNCTAFEVSGHLESGPAADPYTDDVAMCLRSVFSVLSTTSVSATKTNTHGTFSSDQNSNGVGVHLNQNDDQYQSGMMLDAVTASGTPNKAVAFGPLSSLGHPPAGAAGTYTYKDAVTDMVDYNVYCQSSHTTSSNQGAWDYGCNEAEDNSTTQWVAIGLISAARDFGITVPTGTRQASVDWVNIAQVHGFGGNGYFGYRNSSPLWGPYAVTPSGMVQMAFDGLGRSPTATCCTAANNSTGTAWDWAETFMRDNFDTAQTNSPYNDVKDYYYGMFSLTKSMLLHDSSGTGLTTTPIQFMRSLDNAAKPPIDWYAAQNATYGGTDTSNGVARTLVSGTPSNGVSGQNANGSWGAHGANSGQDPFTTAWAIIMLNRTVTQLQPVACAANVAGTNNTSIQLNGQCSSHNDPNKSLVSWDWDVDNTWGTNFTKHGVIVNNVFTKPNDGSVFPYNYKVRLRVTDNNNPALTADYIFTVTLNAPGGVVAPVANAGGPYHFCPNLDNAGNPLYTPWTLDGSLSSQAPPDTITTINWDFLCGNTLNDSHVLQPRVDIGTNNYFSRGPGAYCAKLQVVNNDNLQSTITATVTVHNPSDPQCSNCVQQPTGKAKNAAPGSPGNAQLYWADSNSAAFPVHHYNIYRSTTANFATQVQIAGVNGVYPAVPVPAVQGSQMSFVDATAATAATYYYRISPATAADINTCTSPLTVQVVVKAALR